MNNIQIQIVKAAGCNVLDITFTTLKSIEKDLKKRLVAQLKTLFKWKDKWVGKEIVEQSIKDLSQTLLVITKIKK